MIVWNLFKYWIYISTFLSNKCPCLYHCALWINYLIWKILSFQMDYVNHLVIEGSSCETDEFICVSGIMKSGRVILQQQQKKWVMMELEARKCFTDQGRAELRNSGVLRLRSGRNWFSSGPLKRMHIINSILFCMYRCLHFSVWCLWRSEMASAPCNWSIDSCEHNWAQVLRYKPWSSTRAVRAELYLYLQGMQTFYCYNYSVIGFKNTNVWIVVLSYYICGILLQGLQRFNVSFCNRKWSAAT